MPHLKGLVKPVVTPYVYTQNAQFFLPFSLDPQECKICVASSHFVATLIFPRWGQLGTKVGY